VTVAGHDHLVAAFASGISGPGQVFNSAGTGDVILSIVSPPDDALRAGLVFGGATSGAYIDGESTAVNAGTRGGLVLESVLAVLGAGDVPSRVELDDSLGEMEEPFDPGHDQRVRVTGAARDATRVRIDYAVSDPTPVEIWAAALRETVRESGRLWALTRDLTPSATVQGAGGWTRLEGVRAAKRRVFGRIDFLAGLEAGAIGAAALGAGAARGTGYRGAVELLALRRARA
jgi:sugar (pentulose or hexulose) kinase